MSRSAIVLLVVLAVAFAQAAPRVEWKDMLQFFSPPEQYKDKFGDYRSVMKFDNGSEVKTPADWPRRRAEILKYWHGVMGSWNAVLEKPEIKNLSKEHVENFTRYKIHLEIAPGRFQESYLLVPDGKGPSPAVLVTWYNHSESAGIPNKPGDKIPVYAFGYDLARRGFVTLCIGGPGVAADKGLQPSSFAAYCAANACNALANLPEVDSERSGVTGFSYGGKWAMFASCLYERFACAVWVDPGIVWNEKDPNANWWEPWYLGLDPSLPTQRKPGVVKHDNPRTGAYKRLVEEHRDIHELHALMAPRPFLVSGGAQDRPEHWVALNHAIALNKFLGFKNRVAMTMRNGHTPTLESNAQMYAFFEHFLKGPAQ